MPHLPSGTITFLFSDIEGSTRLLQALGPDGYARALGESQALLRAIWVAHGGAEVDTAGDGFFIAFASAPAAVAAAADATRALADHPWPQGQAIRVRIGLHTGAPQLVGDHYVGLDVHRAARIAAAGHGGQALLSQATRELAERDLPEGATLRDLGPQRLKDLQHAERLAQLVLPNLPTDFPALKTLDRRAHNLPIQPTPLLGREETLAAVGDLLRREGVRLVTLTGPGGIGKTRLSLQIAAELLDDFADGVWFVRLSRLSDPTLVIPTIAQTLGLKEGSQPALETLRAYLGDRSLLLVLDNFEQIVEAAADVGVLLESSPNLKLLATSRIPLRLRGERRFPVPPLALAEPRQSPSPERLTQYAAVALFVERAGEAQPDFTVTAANAPAIAEICAQLDGLPLAIELAAARTRLLPPEALLGRLSSQLKLLTGGARDLEARQQTMRATLTWSESLLSPAEQALFRRLAVFVGGATLEAAESICAAPADAEPLALDALDGLGALVDESLVQQRDEGGEPRFGMLHIIREYALERLEASDEAAALHRAHADYFLALAEVSESRLHGPRQVEAMAQLEREMDNLRAALEWSFAHDAEVAARLFAALGNFLTMHGHWIEKRQWGARALAEREAIPDALRARVLASVGYLANNQGDYAFAAGVLNECLDIARRLDDRPTIAYALMESGTSAQHQEDFERARRLYGESLAAYQSIGDQNGVLQVTRCQANVAYALDDIASEQRLVEQALVLARALGDTHDIAECTSRLGWRALLRGDVSVAETLLQEALATQRQIGDANCSSISLGHLGMAALERNDAQTGLQRLEESLALYEQIAATQKIAYTLDWLAEARLVGGDIHGAEEAGQASLRAEQRIGRRQRLSACLETLAQVACARGRYQRAARLLGAAESALGALPPLPLPPALAARHARAAAGARDALGNDVWTAAFAEGKALALEEAIALALGE